MRKISPKVKEKVIARKQVCARAEDGGCGGNLTWEHALIYGGRQIDEAWAIVILCSRHHGVNEYQDRGDLQKEKNVWLALNQATEDELRQYSKVIDYVRLRKTLNEKYQNHH